MKTITSDKVDGDAGHLGSVLGLVTNSLCDPGQASSSSSLDTDSVTWYLPRMRSTVSIIAGSHRQQL